MKKKKTNDSGVIVLGFFIKLGQGIKHLAKALVSFLKTILLALATLIRAVAYLIRDVFGALEKFAKVVAILLISISFSVLAIFVGLYILTATFGLKDSPVFQEVRDKVATIYLEEINEELNELETELDENEAQ